MKQQTSEEEDIFHWLKLQATNGVFSAQVRRKYIREFTRVGYALRLLPAMAFSDLQKT